MIFLLCESVDCQPLELVIYSKRAVIRCVLELGKKIIQSSLLLSFSFIKMAKLRNKRMLVAVPRETQEEHPRNGQSRNTSVPRINEEYITQVSEEIEGRVTKTVPGIQQDRVRHLGALFKLDDFPLNPQLQMFSGTVQGTSRSTDGENPEPSGDLSRKDPHPEVESPVYRSRNSIDSDPDEAYHNYTKIEHVKAWLLSWSLAKVPTVSKKAFQSSPNFFQLSRIFRKTSANFASQASMLQEVSKNCAL